MDRAKGRALAPRGDAVAIAPLPPVSATGSINGNQFKLQFTGFTNLSYSVIGTMNLTLPLANWSSLGTAQWLSNNLFEFTDTVLLNQGQQFYRVRLDD